MRKLTVGSCFSGIGGIELGLEWTGGFETRWQIENDEYASRVLAKHWPNVKRYSDIRDVVRPEPVDLICGGFPCQDVSLAGKRAGLEGKRSTLWGEMFRLVCEVKPRWVLAENVPGLLSSDDGRFFGNILRDLAFIGFDAEWQVLSAAGVGAPHLRQRLFIVSYPHRIRHVRGEGVQEGKQYLNWRQALGKPDPLPANVSDAGSKSSTQSVFAIHCHEEIKRRKTEKVRGKNREESKVGTAIFTGISGIGEWLPEPQMARMVDGVPEELEQIRCLGNAVVPQVAQKVGEMILNFEKEEAA